MDTVVNSKEESDPRKNLWSASNTGTFRTPLLPNVGWEVISHKKGGGKREIKVQICYSHSLKRHHFLESRSCVSWRFPAPVGSFSTVLGNCLTVLSFVTRGSRRPVLLYLCIGCILPPGSESCTRHCSLFTSAQSGSAACIPRLLASSAFLYLFIPSTRTLPIIKRYARTYTRHPSFH